MKKGLIIVAVALLIAFAFSSCKSSKCPAYGKNETVSTEQVRA